MNKRINKRDIDLRPQKDDLVYGYADNSEDRYRIIGDDVVLIHTSPKGGVTVTQLDYFKIDKNQLSDVKKYDKENKLEFIKSGNIRTGKVCYETLEEMIPSLDFLDCELCDINCGCIYNLEDAFKVLNNCLNQDEKEMYLCKHYMGIPNKEIAKSYKININEFNQLMASIENKVEIYAEEYIKKTKLSKRRKIKRDAKKVEQSIKIM